MDLNNALKTRYLDVFKGRTVESLRNELSSLGKEGGTQQVIAMRAAIQELIGTQKSDTSTEKGVEIESVGNEKVIGFSSTGFPVLGLNENGPIKVPGTDERGFPANVPSAQNIFINNVASRFKELKNHNKEAGNKFNEYEGLRKGFIFSLRDLVVDFLKENPDVDESGLVNKLSKELGLDPIELWDVKDSVNRKIEEYKFKRSVLENPVDEWDSEIVANGGVKSVRDWIEDEYAGVLSPDLSDSVLERQAQYVKGDYSDDGEHGRRTLNKLNGELQAILEITGQRSVLEGGILTKAKDLIVEIVSLTKAIENRDKEVSEIAAENNRAIELEKWRNAYRRVPGGWEDPTPKPKVLSPEIINKNAEDVILFLARSVEAGNLDRNRAQERFEAHINKLKESYPGFDLSVYEGRVEKLFGVEEEKVGGLNGTEKDVQPLQENDDTSFTIKAYRDSVAAGYPVHAWRVNAMREDIITEVTDGFVSKHTTQLEAEESASAIRVAANEAKEREMLIVERENFLAGISIDKLGREELTGMIVRSDWYAQMPEHMKESGAAVSHIIREAGRYPNSPKARGLLRWHGYGQGEIGGPQEVQEILREAAE